MDTVTLKNGSEECVTLVSATMHSIRALGPIELYELVAICRNPSHVPFGTTGTSLKAWGLLEMDGRPHSSIKNIVLSAATGEGLELRLGNPVQAQ